MDTKILLNKLLEKQDLNHEEASFLLEQIINGELNDSQIAAILTALRVKGEAKEEIAGFIKVLRKHMVSITAPKGAIDVVGTGGDRSGTFNISTAAALVVAGAGVAVAKHGNRAASSKCGSADVLESLGVQIMTTPEQAEEILQKVGMVFLFAPLYHPAFKTIAPIRKELGFPTVFNYLGPFLNPAKVTRQLVGVPNKKVAEKLAQVATELGFEHLLIVTSADTMDEVSISNSTSVFEIQNKTVKSYSIHPSDFGLKTGLRNDILGSDAKENAEIIKQVLKGQKGSRRDIVVLNAACALYVSGKTKDIQEGIRLAEESIDSGSAQEVLHNLIKETQKYV